jgi:hypothetical protein
MDVLIKRKQYHTATEFLNETTEEKDWKIYLDTLTKNDEFLSFFKDYITGLKCAFTLKLFLNKLFNINNKDKKFQETIYEIIITLLETENEFNNNYLIKNLLYIQCIKISILDSTHKEKLKELITKNKFCDPWLVGLLESFQYNSELGYLYESLENYDKSLKYFEICNDQEKINIIKSKIENSSDNSGIYIQQQEKINNSNINNNTNNNDIVMINENDEYINDIN